MPIFEQCPSNSIAQTPSFLVMFSLSARNRALVGVQMNMRIAGYFASLLALSCLCALGQTELIINGTFEQAVGTEWHVNGSGVDVRSNSSFSHNGSGYLKMGEVPTVTETIYQLITVPTNTVAAVLSYWRNILCFPINDG